MIEYNRDGSQTTDAACRPKIRHYSLFERNQTIERKTPGWGGTRSVLHGSWGCRHAQESWSQPCYTGDPSWLPVALSVLVGTLVGFSVL